MKQTSDLDRNRRSQAAYLERFNRVFEYIDTRLDRDLSIATLSSVACFSQYHFHRLFKAVVGENLNAYVNRLRLGRAAHLLKHSPSLTVTEAAFEVGFNSLEHFSRCFRAHYGFAPSRLKREGKLRNSKIYQDANQQSFYDVFERSRRMPPADFKVRTRSLPDMRVAYVRGVFGEDGGTLMQAYLDLMEWTERHGYLTRQSVRLGLIRDDVEVVPAAQCRYDYCITVPPDAKPEGAVGVTTLAGGRHALLHCVGDIYRVAQGWDHLYRDWLLESGCQPADQAAREVFLQGPESIGWDRFDLDLGLPIRPLWR